MFVDDNGQTPARGRVAFLAKHLPGNARYDDKRGQKDRG
jgi:hypothetical protein